MSATNSLPRTLRLASVGAVPRCSERAIAALQHCSDIPALADLAFEHKMAPWLASAVTTSPKLTNDPRFAPIRAAGSRQTLQTLGLFGELAQLLRSFARESVDVVLLKGPVIAESYYPDPALRPYGDLDLLIHEPDLQRVSRLLLDRGYEEKRGTDPHRLHGCHGIFQQIFVDWDKAHVVELHCDHLQIGLEPLSMDEIWSEATEISIGGSNARALEEHDLFVQLCVHLQRHGFSRLSWFKDLDLIVRRGSLDWDTVLAKAARQGCADSVSYALWLLRRTLGTPLPRGAQVMAGRQPWLSRRIDRLLWPPNAVVNLVPQRKWRFRRLVQFAPESGVLRGGLPSLLTTGRRTDKLRVMAAAVRAHHPSPAACTDSGGNPLRDAPGPVGQSSAPGE